MAPRAGRRLLRAGITVKANDNQGFITLVLLREFFVQFNRNNPTESTF